MSSSRAITIEAARKLINEHTESICDDQLVQNPLISVCLLTYNHRPYIQQALDGALEQKISVPFEVVIGDDCSNDGTTEIVRECQQKHPGRVRVLLATQNLGQHTGNGRLNFIRTVQSCRGKYVALIEGDDYWTATKKLQTQFDALEAHPNWAICFHRAQVVDQRPGRTNFEMPGADAREIYTLTDVLSENFMATASVMYRNGLIGALPQWFYHIRFADWPLHVLNAQHGEIGFLHETMSVFRIHEGCTFSAKDDEFRSKATLECFETLRQNLQQDHELDFAAAKDRLTARMFGDTTRPQNSVDELRQSLSLRIAHWVTWPLRLLTKPFKDK